MTILLTVGVLLAGLFLWLVAAAKGSLRAVPVEIGRLMFFVGLFWLVYSQLGVTLRFMRP